MKKVKTLIISDTYDFATDYITTCLYEKKWSYLRLNRDQLSSYEIEFDIDNGILKVIIDNEEYFIDDDLRSVYYRAPTFLRETFLEENTVEKQLESSQWISFIRNLVFFKNASWMNNPIDTYACENKMLQLRIAKETGLKIPRTYVSNRNYIGLEADYIVKSIDTVVLKDMKEEAFFYSNITNNAELKKYDNRIAPLFFQEYLREKVDIRVTVVGNKLFGVNIVSKDGGTIHDDWRKKKSELKYIPIILPEKIGKAIIELMKKFNLYYSGIDLIKYNNEYYFLEINPTGEWAWLVETTDYPIDRAIAEWLEKR